MAHTKVDHSRRTSRKAERQRRQERRQLYSRLLWSVAALAAIAVLGYIIWNLVRPKLGLSVAQQTRTHIQVGDSHEPYNSNPPTSGAHAAPITEGFYETAVPDENLVHNLEHGYVIFWYNCSTLDEAQCQTLKTQIKSVIARASSVAPFSQAKKLIAVPRNAQKVLLALTTWGRLYELNAFDESGILQFINDFRQQAPEGGAP